jgi:hypothetical protein
MLKGLKGPKASVSAYRIGVHAADQTVPFFPFRSFFHFANIAYSAFQKRRPMEQFTPVGAREMEETLRIQR